ncbi:hypothetical protein H5410_044751 [Solanum commersonii]|uniref:Uncharacterized protein n=1 Tax=Solanum commersonii TaxID=4109 RepID=A0A9J5X9V0_SOLCO|nr:hypothetical protein H5410_044751 [Solanum commersonii]
MSIRIAGKFQRRLAQIKPAIRLRLRSHREKSTTYRKSRNRRTARDSKVLENALVEPTSQLPFPPHHENIVADDFDQQAAQSNNVGSSSQSHDQEMQVQREKIVHTM